MLRISLTIKNLISRRSRPPPVCTPARTRLTQSNYKSTCAALSRTHAYDYSPACCGSARACCDHACACRDHARACRDHARALIDEQMRARI